jgi:hypothetical protein
LLTPPGWLAYASDHSYRLARSIPQHPANRR